MATIKRTLVSKPSEMVVIWKWEGLTTGSLDGDPLGPDQLEYVDRTIQVVSGGGAGFDGGTVVIQGSNDGVNWVTLNAPGNSALSFTSAALRQILESAAYIRPLLSGGTTPDVDVILVGRRATRGIN